MKIKMRNKTPAAIQNLASNAKLQKCKLPPDPDGLFKRAAARGKKVIAMYGQLNPDAEGNLLNNLMLDLICLSDRDTKVGNVHQEYVSAVQTYEKFVAENMWALGWYDDLEAAQEAAEEMTLSNAKRRASPTSH